MKQFFYEGVPLTVVTSEIVAVREEYFRYEIEALNKHSGDISYHFILKECFENPPKKGDLITEYVLDDQCHGMDINGEPFPREDGFEEKDV